MGRMSKLSRDNMSAAERIEICEVKRNTPTDYFVAVYAGDRSAIVHSGAGWIVHYPSYHAARRSVKRVRPDIAPLLVQEHTAAYHRPPATSEDCA